MMKIELLKFPHLRIWYEPTFSKRDILTVLDDANNRNDFSSQTWTFSLQLRRAVVAKNDQQFDKMLSNALFLWLRLSPS